MNCLEVGSFYEITFEYPKVTQKYYVVSKKVHHENYVESYFLIHTNNAYNADCDYGSHYWDRCGYDIKTKFYNPRYAEIRKLYGEEMESLKSKLFHFKKFWSYPYV